MNKFAFVSDFDGTLTDRDFYHIVIDKYLKDWGRQFYEDWKRTSKINVEFLNRIFGAMDRSESEIYEDILNLPFDRFAQGFMKEVGERGGKFFILSAGTSYYIDILLEHLDIKDVTVISMKGIYKGRGIQIIPDKNGKYYSDIFGLDKRKVIEELKKEYKYVLFAGDSEPDLAAAKAADFAFAKAELADLLRKEGADFIPFNNYSEIKNFMDKKGWRFE